MVDVVTRAQAIHAGRSTAQIDALVRSGRWRALRRGTYWTSAELPADPATAAAAHVRAAALASGVPCVGSHESAALVHGLPLFVPYAGSPLLSRRREPRGVRPDARTCAPLVSHVPPEHVVTLHGAEVTSLARTAVDLARVRLPLTAVIVLDAAMARGVTREQLLEVLTVQAGWPGIAQARLRVSFTDGRSESPLESLGRLRFAQLELPPPDLQVTLRGELGPLGRVDHYWEEFRTVGEADGRGKYQPAPGGSPDDAGCALFAEKVREDGMRDEGYEVFRYTWHEAVHRPQLLRDRALRAFARGAPAARRR